MLFGSGARAPTISLVLVIVVAEIMSAAMILPALPALVEQLAGSNARAGVVNGWFVAIVAAMQFLISPLVGSLSDRFGRRPLLLISIGALPIDFILMALAPGLWWIAAGRMITGITSSVYLLFAYMADITPPERRARGFGLIGASFSFSFIFGPLIGGSLVELAPRAPFWAAAILAASGFFYVLFIVPESLAPEKRMAFSWQRANPIGSVGLIRSHVDLPKLAIISFFLNFIQPFFQTVLVLYTGYRYGWQGIAIGGMFALIGISGILVQGVFVGRVAQRLGDQRTLILGLMFGVIGLTAMGLASTGAMFALGLVIYSLFGLAVPTIHSLMSRCVTESEQGQIQGANNSITAAAGVVAPLLFGFIYSQTVGDNAIAAVPGAAFLVAATILILSAGVGLSLHRSSQLRVATTDA